MSIKNIFEHAKEKASEQASSKIDSRKSMTRDAKHNSAIDYTTRQIKDFAEKSGREITHSQAHNEAVTIAHRVIRKNGL